ncbi:GGDEF domain-containing protein [Leeia sp. TBRC 13508]|uniref:GGDEF domain-containing protein n=1 Tax=Leeia speluncae TaxID=2884804 RepID=A0ABS8D6N9_9NEIS|nr:GGDEF domain-containing protein [Leeia speluncae]MCB6183303.1 GGDEF domain-containing protein [Leeia speluncae]
MSILDKEELHAHFQPIVDLKQGRILGFEGLIRGPVNSTLASPAQLFDIAARHGLLLPLEAACRRVIIRQFAERQLPGNLFLNTNPDCFFSPAFSVDMLVDIAKQNNFPASRIVLEITESRPVTGGYQALLRSLTPYRNAGIKIALDDLGAGFSSLRLWYELQPDFVKIDMHFVQEIDRDPLKKHFTTAVQHLTALSGSCLIAEGIETHEELRILQELGVAFGQGYLLGKPMGLASPTMNPDVLATIQRENERIQLHQQGRKTNHSLSLMMQTVAPVSPETLSETVYQRFANDPELYALPVVADGRPIGMLDRQTLLELFAGHYKRDLYGRKPCHRLMDTNPLVVDATSDLSVVSQQVVAEGRSQLSKGFIVTEGGYYRGIASAYDVMRAMSAHQLNQARYANPLTQLPGNVPIDEQVDMLIANNVPFVACYADLDHFKPFNDVYGYRKGDDIIRLTANLLLDISQPKRDFVGHIGGDDFIVLMQSADWEHRCRMALQRFDQDVSNLFLPGHREQGGFMGVNRQGENTLIPLTSLSIGAVVVPSGACSTHHDLAELAAEVKHMAKMTQGSSLSICHMSQAWR